MKIQEFYQLFELLTKFKKECADCFISYDNDENVMLTSGFWDPDFMTISLDDLREHCIKNDTSEISDFIYEKISKEW